MALSATVQWDVRTTGNDANGGAFDPGVGSPGTDYSQQNSAQVAFSDLVIGATNTQLTSVANPFSPADAGNIINITGGSGFTTGRYEIVSVSGITATMDRAVGTASSTGGTGNLGGSMATIAAAVVAAATSNTVNIQAATYTFTTSLVISQSTLSLIGYQATHNDGGTKPLITTATNSTTLINTNSNSGGYWLFSNLSLSNTAGTPASGIWQLSSHGTAQTWVISGCKFSGFAIGIDSSDGTPDDVAYIHVINTEVTSCAIGLSTSSGSEPLFTKIFGCYFHGNTEHLIAGGSTGPLWVEKSIFTGSSSTFGLNISAPVVLIDQCVFANNSNGSGTLGLATSGTFASVTNSIFYGNSTVALVGNSTTAYFAGSAASRCNAFGSNGTNYTGWSGSPGDVTLTADPFTASGSGDYSLNSTAGGGTACKGAGFPGVFPGAASTGHVDIGAVQTASGGGGGGAGGSYTFLG